MSIAIRAELAGLTEQGEQRRRRTAQIRQESRHLFQWIWELHEARQYLLLPCPHHADQPRMRSEDMVEAPDGVQTPVHELLSEDVLQQVQRLLGDCDARLRDEWTDEDSEILCSLQAAWAAARRKGYSLKNLEAVLRALNPRER